MKELTIGDQAAVDQDNSYKQHGSAYFDGYYFWAKMSWANGDIYIYRNSTLLYTHLNTFDSDTKGYTVPILKVINGVLYIVVVVNESTSSYKVRVYKYTAWNTGVLWYDTTGVGTDYHCALDVFERSGYIYVPLMRYNDTTFEYSLRIGYLSTTTTWFWSGTEKILSGLNLCTGGWFDGSQGWYFVHADSVDGTVISKWDVVGDSIAIQMTISLSDLIPTGNNWQKCWLLEDDGTFFFFNDSDYSIYRGKKDIEGSFSRIIIGTFPTAYGVAFDTNNKIIGFSRLDSNDDVTFYYVVPNGGVEKIGSISGIDYVSRSSNYGFVYLIGDFITGTWYQRDYSFITYTPTKDEVLSLDMFASPIYTIAQTSGTYRQTLLLADDSNNLVFIGHLVDVKDATDMPLTELIYQSNITDDLKRKRSEVYSAQEDGTILNDILDQGCVQLTTEGGSVTSGGSYDFDMKRMSVLEALRWLFNRTMKLPRWDGAGVVSFNVPTGDSGLDIDKDNIVGVLSIETENGKFGLVILEGDDISVQAPVADGGDGVYYDYYPYISDVDELQAIADNLATMQFNQYEKIVVMVKDTGILNIGDYVDLLYNPHARINIDDQYYIAGFDYNPYSNTSRIRLANALFIDSIMDEHRQTNVNTQKLNEIASNIVSTPDHNDLDGLNVGDSFEHITQTQKNNIHVAATVSGNGIAISTQQISLSIGTGSTQVAAGNHGHSGYLTTSWGADVDGNGYALTDFGHITMRAAKKITAPYSAVAGYCHQLANAHIGYVYSNTSWAGIKHVSAASGSQWSLMTGVSGATYVNGSPALYFRVNNSNVGRWYTSGLVIDDGYHLYNIEAYQDDSTNGNYMKVNSDGLVHSTGSSRDIKTDIRYIQSVEDVIDLLKPCVFKDDIVKTSSEFDNDNIGFIAEDIRDACHIAAIYKVNQDPVIEKDPLGEDVVVGYTNKALDPIKVVGFEFTAIMAINTKAIQELRVRVKTLEAEILILKG